MPNAQGGMTAEEEAAWIAQRLQGSQYTPPTQESAGGLLSAIEEQVQPPEPAFIGLGPPYTESARPYSGPPPLDPGIWTEAAGTAPEPGQLRYEGGVAMPVNWQEYKGNTSTGGGFFTMDQIFANGGLPDVFQSGSGMPSTNNWRLIPGGRPGLVMRNGRIIDTNDPEGMYGPHGMGEFGGGYLNPRWRSGSGLGVPAAYASGSIAGTVFGWPGQLDQIGYINPAN